MSKIWHTCFHQNAIILHSSGVFSFWFGLRSSPAEISTIVSSSFWQPIFLHGLCHLCRLEWSWTRPNGRSAKSLGKLPLFIWKESRVEIEAWTVKHEISQKMNKSEIAISRVVFCYESLSMCSEYSMISSCSKIYLYFPECTDTRIMYGVSEIIQIFFLSPSRLTVELWGFRNRSTTGEDEGIGQTKDAAHVKSS